MNINSVLLSHHLQISTLPILSVEDEATLNDDEECAARQIVRHVCVALKRYLEAHLCIKIENLRRTQFRETGGHLEPILPPAKVRNSVHIRKPYILLKPIS